MVAGGRLTDWVSLGVLASFVPRDAVDDAIAAAGRQARRSDGKLPPHVMVYFAMALALFADDDYEEVVVRLTDTLRAWGCWDEAWSVPGSGGITQARQRLGYEPLKELFGEVAAPVAEELTAGAFLGGWRLMAIDGFEWDAPDTGVNAAAFGFAGASGKDRPAFPKVRVVTISECASHAVVDAAIGGVAGKGAGEQSLARKLYKRLEEDWLLIADRNFFNWADWCTAADSGAALLWRVKADLTLPVLELLPDGSYSSVLVNPKIKGKARQALIEAARAGQDLEEDKARYVRVVEYGRGSLAGRPADGQDLLRPRAPRTTSGCPGRYPRSRPAASSELRARCAASHCPPARPWRSMPRPDHPNRSSGIPMKWPKSSEAIRRRCGEVPRGGRPELSEPREPAASSTTCILVCTVTSPTIRGPRAPVHRSGRTRCSSVAS